ncbi:MAG: leucine-rich repeat domain-containing protein [Anaerolineae bacterium]
MKPTQKVAHENAPHFADQNLAQAVCETLGEAITWAGLTELTELIADARGIYSLAGLEFAVQLTHLSLVDNEIEALTPLKSLVELKTLRLHDNRCWDLRPLAKLTQLRGLTLGGFWVDEDVGTLTLEAFGPAWGPAVSDLTPVRALHELRELRVWHHCLKEIDAVSGLSQLAKLTLDGYQGGGPVKDWTALRGLENIRELSLCSNRLADNDLIVIAELPQLEQVDLRHNQITDVAVLVQKRNLKAGACLDLRGNPLGHDAQKTQIPQLQARGVRVITE